MRTRWAGGFMPGACALHKTPLCWIPPHNNRRSRQRLNGTARGRCTFRLPIAPAACEQRVLDGVTASCVAMTREVVKRLRQRRETSVLQRASRWRLYAFGALPDYPCTSRQLTASPWRGSFREGRSGDVAAITEETHLATELKQRAASSPSALCPIPLR